MPKSPGVISGALVVCAQSVVNTTRSPECSGVVVDNLIMATDYRVVRRPATANRRLTAPGHQDLVDPA